MAESGGGGGTKGGGKSKVKQKSLSERAKTYGAPF